MAKLIVEHHLLCSPENDALREMARIRTLATLRNLDGFRKRSLLEFLYESNLIQKTNTKIKLSGAEIGIGDDFNMSTVNGVPTRNEWKYIIMFYFQPYADLSKITLPMLI